MGLLFGRETEDGYKPSLQYRWFKPAIAGNTINGLGEDTVRPPSRVFHYQGVWHPWRMVQEMFYWRLMPHPSLWGPRIKSAKLDAKKPMPIAETRVELSPEEWARRVKDHATKELGIGQVGIVRVRPEWVFEGEELPEKWAIIIACRMDYEALAQASKRKFKTSLGTVMETYYDGHARARRLTDWIREQGWHAVAHGTPMVSPLNIIPAAIEAGIGELGKHGSMINREMGSNFRLAYVATDLPLAEDSRDDFGSDDFCMSCQLCTTECPPHALSDTKQLVRGVKKWYVNFDKCLPYINDRYGCGICIAVCPWSRPGIAPRLAEKMLKKRAAYATAGGGRSHGSRNR